MNAHDIIREPFARIFGKEPERDINPPDEPILNIDVAVKRLEKSLTAQKASEFWDDFIVIFHDEMSEEEKDQQMVAVMEDDKDEQMLISKKVYKRAIRTMAQMFLGQLGGSV